MSNSLPEAVYSALLSAMPREVPVSRSDLTRYDIPVPVAHFLEHALDRRLELETSRIMDLASAWVDHDRQEVVLARQAYIRLLARYAHYPAAEWPRALRQAAQLVTAFLIRPVPTLLHFVFGEKRSELPGDDVMRRVDYFIGYSHLRAAVDAFVERCGDEPVSRRGLSDALEMVDRRIFAEYGAREWNDHVAPLASLGRFTPEGGLDLELLSRFFKARGAMDIVAGIRGYARARGLDALSGEQIEAAILLATDSSEAAGASAEELAIADGAPGTEVGTKVVDPEIEMAPIATPAAPEPEPIATPAAPEPEPIAEIPEPEPEPIAGIPKPEPEPIAGIPKPEPVPAAGPVWIESDADIADPEPPEPDQTRDDLLPIALVPTPPAPAPLIIESEPDPDAAAILGAHDGPLDDPAPEIAAEHRDADSQPLWLQYSATPETPTEPTPDDSDEPLWKRFQDKLREGEDADSGSRVVRLHPTPRAPQTDDADTPTLEFAVLGPEAWQRDRFIQDLFGGSAEAYEQALLQLREAPNWRAASDIMAVDVFRVNRVNIYHETAIDFTNAVEAQFNKR